MMEVQDIDSEKIIKVKSKEGKVFEATLKQLKMCGTISEMIESLGDGDLTEIPLIQIDSVSLEKILKWTHKNKGTEQPTSEEIKNKTADSIDQWDEDFLKMPLKELYDLITACNYLSLPGLLWLTTREIAYMIKGKDPEEVRQLFGIENDWTPDELEKVQRENSYCEEYRD